MRVTIVRGAWGWRVWLVLAVPVVAGYLAIPDGSVASSVVYDVVGLVSASMIVLAVRRHRPARPVVVDGGRPGGVGGR